MVARLLAQRQVMRGRFDDNLVSAAAAHATEQRPFFDAAWVLFDAKCRELVGYHPHPPTRCIGCCVGPHRVNLRRGQALVTRTKRAQVLPVRDCGTKTVRFLAVVRPTNPFRGEDHPIVDRDIVAQDRHGHVPFWRANEKTASRRLQLAYCMTALCVWPEPSLKVSQGSGHRMSWIPSVIASGGHWRPFSPSGKAIP